MSDEERGSSPNGSIGDLVEDEVSPHQNPSTKSAKDNLSLKRAREGSVEPLAAIPPSDAGTKKNRLTDDLPKAPRGFADRTEPGVGEVQRKVEKMTHEDSKETERDRDLRPGVEQELDLPEKEDKPDSAMSLSTHIEEDETAQQESEWEEIGDKEVEEAKSETGSSEGLKRKVLDRTESSRVEDEIEAHAKKQKDSPSPTPDEMPVEGHTKPVEATITKDEASVPEVEPVKKPQATFGAFASSASPFSAARSASPFGAAAASGSTSTPSKPSPFASSGFGNYSSTSSPFAKKPPAKEAGEDGENDRESEAGPSTFGDILQDSGTLAEEQSKVRMQEQSVPTGEEEEETLYQTRAKLYFMRDDGGWKERGTGTLKLNVRRSDRKGARLVMRAEGVLRLILNVSLYAGMSCLEDGKHIRSTVFEDGEKRLITISTGAPKHAAELAAVIQQNTPTELSAPPIRSPMSETSDTAKTDGWDDAKEVV